MNTEPEEPAYVPRPPGLPDRPARTRRVLARLSPRARALGIAAALAFIEPSITLISAPHATACPVGGCPTPPPTQPVNPDPPTPPSAAGCGANAAATAPPAGTARITAVTGDSFSSGEGTGGYLPGNSGDSTFWAHKSPYAQDALAWLYLESSRLPSGGQTLVYDGHMQTTWGTGQLQFAASSGAVSSHLQNPQTDQDTGLLRNPAQESQFTSNANVVMFGFGGNDAGYGQIWQAALLSYIKTNGADALLSGGGIPFGASPSWPANQLAAVQAQLAKQTANLPAVQSQLLSELYIAKQDAPHAMIVVDLYPIGLLPSGNPSLPMMAGPTLDAIYPYGNALNSVIRAAVNAYNAANPGQIPIEIYDPNVAGPGGSSVVAGHELGGSSSYFNPWTINESELLSGNQLHAFQESFHPNRAGNVALAQALATWLQQKCPGLWPNPPTFNQVTIEQQTAYQDVPPAQLWADVQQNMQMFCANNPSLVGCTPASGGYTGGGGGMGGGPSAGTDPAPGSPGFDLWLGAWLAAGSPTGSTAADNGSSGGGDGGSSSGSGSSSTYTPCCGRSVYFIKNADGTYTAVEYGGDLTGNLYTLMPPGFVPPANSTVVPASDPVQDPVDNPDDGDNGTPPGDATTGGTTDTGTTDTGTTSTTDTGTTDTGTADSGTTGTTDSGTTGTADSGATGTADSGATGGDSGGGGGGTGGSCDSAAQLMSESLTVMSLGAHSAAPSSTAATDASASSNVLALDDPCDPTLY